MRILLSLFFTTVSVIAGAQSVHIVSAETGNPVAGAHVVWQNGSLKELFISNDNGVVSLPSSHFGPGSRLQISCIGFKTITDSLLRGPKRRYELAPLIKGLETIVVTAQMRPGNPSESVMPIRIIDEQQINRMGAQHLRDVLTNSLNMRLGQDQILGSSLQMQGVGGQNIKILVDGVPVNGRLNGNIDLSQLNLHLVERIEVVEGPLSVLYGTDAMGGTINLITRKTNNEKFEAGLQTHYESVGQYNIRLHGGFQRRNKGFRLTVGRHYFDGWSESDQPFALRLTQRADSSRQQAWNPKLQHFATAQFRWSVVGGELRFMSDYFDETISNLGYPRAPFGTTAFDDFYATRRFNQQLQWEKQDSSNRYHVLLARNDFRRIKNTWFSDLTNLERRLTNNDGDQDTSRFIAHLSRGTYQRRFNQQIQAEFGYDVRHEYTLGARIANQRQAMLDLAVFASAEWLLAKGFTLRPSARFTYNPAYPAPVVPGLQFRYEHPLNKRQLESLTHRFSYARGFRAPDLKELYFFFVDVNHNIQGNPNLRAESGHNFHFTSTYNRQQGNQLITAEISMFYNRINQLIGLAQADATAFSYFNLEEFRSQGVLLRTEWKKELWLVAAGAGVTGRSNRLADTLQMPAFFYSPEINARVELREQVTGTQWNIFYKYTGRTPNVITNSMGNLALSSLSAFHTLDLSGHKAWKKVGIETTIGVKNILDVTNILGATPGGVHSAGGMSSPVAMGRLYFVSLQYRFNG